MSRSVAGEFATVVAIAALALIAQPPAAEAQGLHDAFPSKPVRIIVPYTPGSPNDVMARLLAQQLQGKLGQAVDCAACNAQSVGGRRRPDVDIPGALVEQWPGLGGRVV